jgi:translation initiation factor IF-3
VRVIAEDGEQLGVLETRDALRRAREKGLDLVEIAATAQPPVCRIIDYGKFQYEAKKKANEAKKKQVVISVKEVKFRPGTDEHDYTFKMKHARQFLQEGDKVKATIFFRGREITHRELGAELLQRLERDLTDVGEVETRPRMEGNQMFFVFTPKKHKTAGGGGAAKREGGAGASKREAGEKKTDIAPKPDVAPKPESAPTNGDGGQSAPEA